MSFSKRFVPWVNLSLSMFRESQIEGSHHYDETIEAMKSPNYLYTGYWMTTTVGRDGATCELAPSLFLKSSGDVSLAWIWVCIYLDSSYVCLFRIGSSDLGTPNLLEIMKRSRERLLSMSLISSVLVRVLKPRFTVIRLTYLN